jgi:hypothetical protein
LPIFLSTLVFGPFRFLARYRPPDLSTRYQLLENLLVIGNEVSISDTIAPFEPSSLFTSLPGKEKETSRSRSALFWYYLGTDISIGEISRESFRRDLLKEGGKESFVYQ